MARTGAGASRPARRVRFWSLAAVGLVSVVWLSGPKPACAVAAVTLVGIGVARRARARQRAQLLRAAVVELARAIASELRSGRAATAAVEVAVASAAEPLQAVMGVVADVARRGDLVDVGEAVDEVIARAPDDVVASVGGLRALRACLAVASTSGAVLAPAVDRVADALQDEIELDRALAGSLAAPRATVRLLAALPIFGMSLGSVIGADPLQFLIGSPAGLACAVGALFLDAAGIAWAARIAHKAARIG